MATRGLGPSRKPSDRGEGLEERQWKEEMREWGDDKETESGGGRAGQRGR